MNRKLLEILCCPACQADLKISKIQEEQNGQLKTGSLCCLRCEKSYLIEDGVPRLVIGDEDVMTIGQRFNYQWVLHMNGKFERGTCYGYSDQAFVEWLRLNLEKMAPPSADEWILDAGCGNGQKTALLADGSPTSHVVGIDLGLETLKLAMNRYGHKKNVDFVQANILTPPFKPNVFTRAISIGVLHHTPHPQEAFHKFCQLIKSKGGIIIWIYPPWKEAHEWLPPYIGRFVFFLGRSYVFPPMFLRWLSYILAWLFFPLTDLIVKRSLDKAKNEMPFVKYNFLNLKQRYRIQVFILFDTLLPRYQFHYPESVIKTWIEKEGLQLAHRGHGYYCAFSSPAASHMEKEGLGLPPIP